MDFGFSEQQQMLRTSARDFLAKECPTTKVRELEESEKGYDPQMWHAMAELGWMGLLFPDEYGGSAGNFMDLVVLMEEMGRSIAPSPFFSTVCLSALPILQFGSNEQKEHILPKVAKGEEILALALTEASMSLQPSNITSRATSDGQDYLLEGTKFFVRDAAVANHLLVVARTSDKEDPKDGITLFLVDAKSPGIEIEEITTMAKEKHSAVTFNKTKVSKANVIGQIDQGWPIVESIMQRAVILKCAEVVGSCQAVLDMTTQYAKDRIQFDRPIGSFQAIQHRLASMLIDVEGTQFLVYQAACSIEEGTPSDLQVSAAKARANEVFQKATLDGVQIHGAIGFTRDHDIGLYYRRVKAAEFALGDADYHRERIAVDLGL